MTLFYHNTCLNYVGYPGITRNLFSEKKKLTTTHCSFYGKKLKQTFVNKTLVKNFTRTKPGSFRQKWVAVFGPGGGFFGVGTSELIVIGAVAWLVLGPKRLYQLARDIGKISGEIKNVAEEARQTFQQAIDLDAIDGESGFQNNKSSRSEDVNTSLVSSNKKKTMKSLDDMVKTEISKTEKTKNE